MIIAAGAFDFFMAAFFDFQGEDLLLTMVHACAMARI
jgi:hypothetical protein